MYFISIFFWIGFINATPHRHYVFSIKKEFRYVSVCLELGIVFWIFAKKSIHINE